MPDMNQIVNTFSSAITLFESPIFIFIIKTVFLIISGGFAIGIFLFLKKTRWLKVAIIEDVTEIVTHRPYGVQKTFKQWGRVTKRLEKRKEAEYKMAIIEADSLLEDVLREMNYEGETIKDLLEQIDSKIIPNIEEVWQAHKFRNNIVHDPSYELTYEQAKKIVSIYEQTFRDLQMF